MIEIGEYVRTKDGQIYKIEDGTEFYEDSVNIGIGIIPEINGIWVDKEHFTCIDKKQIVEYSFNLIDLIEVGDVIQLKGAEKLKYEVLKISWSKSKGKHIHIKNPLRMEGGKDIFIEDIESLITHEQFEQIKYKVKE